MPAKRVPTSVPAGDERLARFGTIEQVADCVAFIYRPERYGFTRDDKTGHSLVGVGKIYIAKNRNGSTGIARFRYNPSFTRITVYIQPGTQTSLGI